MFQKDAQSMLRENGDFLVRVSQPRTDVSDRQVIISVLINKDIDPQIGVSLIN